MASDKIIVFIAGAHGVGKGLFCQNLAPLINADHLTASDLIRNKKHIGTVKAVNGLDENQTILINEMMEYETERKIIILDGHFCLFDEFKQIKSLPVDVFRKLRIAAIFRLYCDPSTIIERLKKRDGEKISLDIGQIEKLQKSEEIHANFVASELNIKNIIIDVTNNLSKEQMNVVAEKINGRQKS